MIKRLLVLLILIFVLLVPFILAYDLSDLPEPFFVNDNLNATVVVGDNPAREDVLAASDLAILKCSKKYDPLVGCTGTKPIYPANDLKDIFSENLISVGGPCANKISAQIMDLPTTWPECADGFENGTGIIKLYNKWNKTQLVVVGYSAEDTKKVAEVLANYKEYNLSGKEIKISGQVPNLTFQRIITEDERRYCEKDNDCVLTQVGCCGCEYVSVNKKYEGSYRGNCKGISCIAIACSNVGYAKCVNNQCTRIYLRKYCDNNNKCISTNWGCVSEETCKLINESFSDGETNLPCREYGNETCNCVDNVCFNELIED